MSKYEMLDIRILIGYICSFAWVSIEILFWGKSQNPPQHRKII